jgi:hypothetical protein
MGSRVSTPGVSLGQLRPRHQRIGLSLAFTRKGDPCALASPTAELDQLVCRVHKFESFRAALRTGFSQRQIEVAAFVSGAGATICTLLPIGFAFQTGTLHRDECECEAHAPAVFWCPADLLSGHRQTTTGSGNRFFLRPNAGRKLGASERTIVGKRPMIGFLLVVALCALMVAVTWFENDRGAGFDDNEIGRLITGLRRLAARSGRRDVLWGPHALMPPAQVKTHRNHGDA